MLTVSKYSCLKCLLAYLQVWVYHWHCFWFTFLVMFGAKQKYCWNKHVVQCLQVAAAADGPARRVASRPQRCTQRLTVIKLTTVASRTKLTTVEEPWRNFSSKFRVWKKFLREVPPYFWRYSFSGFIRTPACGRQTDGPRALRATCNTALA